MIANPVYSALKPNQVQLLPGELHQRYTKNYQYMMSLSSDKLLLNFYNEAGLLVDSLPSHTLPAGIYTGWESPTCQLRGHFLGHFLSACAWGYAYMANEELKGRGDHIVSELRRCQLENADGWVFSIPRDYMAWIARGKRVWAPQYTIHKTLMGLMDMYRFAGNKLALVIAKDAADWFDRYSAQYTEEAFDDILDVETGGMMEFFADLYEVTGETKHLALMERYYRRRLFEPLIRGEDVLSNMHANTTIPETLGCARAYEVTGDRKYLDACLQYWETAVTNRGYFVTGGQTCYEAWTPPFTFKDRLNEDNQEHCTVYNMIRLADFLFRHTGNQAFLDYIDLNFQNGILAQQHPDSGMVGYYLPMQPGGQVIWGKPTENFWCCHGTLVQVHMLHATGVFYQQEGALLIAQYRPVRAQQVLDGQDVSVEIREDYNFPYSLRSPIPRAIEASYPPLHGRRYIIKVVSTQDVEFELKLRVPDWVVGPAKISIDGIEQEIAENSGVISFRRIWNQNEIVVEFGCVITAHPLPDDSRRVAFRDGPDVLVGLTSNDSLPVSTAAEALSLLRYESRKAHATQQIYYELQGMGGSISMIRLCDLRDEVYTMYFLLASQAVQT
jgi:DUF1680 family protein